MAAKDLYEKDYYAILGVDKKADATTIKKTYRSLARELHPDKTKGDKKLEDRFKEVSEAYEILSDVKKRSEYDQARQAFQSGAYRAGQQPSGDFSDLFSGGGDIFSQLFTGRRGPRKGQDIETEISISFQGQEAQSLFEFLQELAMVQKFVLKVAAVQERRALEICLY
jgi:molecular chaperone DnaJ